MTGDVPSGFYSRPEMRRLRQKLEVQLLDELTRKVAKALRVPGAPAAH